MNHRYISFLFRILFLSVIILQFNCSSEEKQEEIKADLVQRGKYLVDFGGCNDCHSPKVFTPKGPIFDTTLLLSGHIESRKLPKSETVKSMNGWFLAYSELTAWVGPWGISFAANLTPDPATGLGNWTDEIFIKAMRTGKHMGFGRDLLPPMPIQSVASLTDDDLKALFAYLKTLKPISNRVPEPVTPDKVSDFLNKN